MNACEQMRKVKFSSDQLQKWLEEQAERLIRFGYHEALFERKENFLIRIREFAVRQIPPFIEIGEHQLPVLLVIPDHVLRFESQLELLGIRSNHHRPIQRIEEIITPIHQPYLIFGAEYSGLGDISSERAVEYQKSNRWQVLTFDQGLAMIAQCEELQQHCTSLIFAGSYWFDRQVKLVAEYSCLEGERRIMGRAVQASHPCSHFGLCEREPIVSSSTGSGEGSVTEASGRHKTL